MNKGRQVSDNSRDEVIIILEVDEVSSRRNNQKSFRRLTEVKRGPSRLKKQVQD